jgi:heptosyltransferase-2
MLLTDPIAVRNRRAAPGGIASNGRLIPTDRPANLPVKPTRYIPMPIVEYYADLAEAIGCDRPDDRLALTTTPDCDDAVKRRLIENGVAGERPLVVISPGAKYGAAKCWPADRFAAAADGLIDEFGATVVVTCGPGEEAIAGAIRSSMRRRSLVFDTPRLSLGELKSLIRRSDLVLCNDAGPRHIAKAFDVPVVTVFGPTHPVWTATNYPDERTVRVDVDCGPCQQRVCPLGHLQCIAGVSVDMVVRAARSLLPATVAEGTA